VRDRKVLHLTNLDPQLNAADIEVNVLNNHSFHVSGLIFRKHRKTIVTLYIVVFGFAGFEFADTSCLCMH
jgi:hypothetical protein